MKCSRLSPFLLLATIVNGVAPELAQSASPPPSLKANADYRPNVLFLAIDDLNDWLGAAGGHPQARTPNLDRLISQSVFFETLTPPPPFAVPQGTPC